MHGVSNLSRKKQNGSMRIGQHRVLDVTEYEHPAALQNIPLP